MLTPFVGLPATLSQMLEERAQATPHRNFLMFEGRWWTFDELNLHANFIAEQLAAAGVRKGDHVLVMMPSSPFYLALLFAIAKLGAVEVPINEAYRGEVLRHVLSMASPQVAIVDGKHRATVDAVSGGILDPSRTFDPTDARFQWNESRQDQVRALRFESSSLEDPACIIFTSGTTGLSKGVVVSHHHLISFGAFFAEIVDFKEDDTSYNFLPFFHVAAKFEMIGSMLSSGRMLMRSLFSLSRFWSDVEEGQATLCVAVGGLCHMLYGLTEKPTDSMNTLRLIYAVPQPWEFKSKFEQRFGVQLVEAYGSTESNLPIFTRLNEDTPPGSCGRVSDHYDVTLRDELDIEVAAGEPGEICIRPRYAHTMMIGYLGLPEKTAEATLGGWFRSGDRATRNAAGYFFFMDRAKDAIRRRGENISSFEVERLLNAHPMVAESAVIPVKAELAEDEVMAIVVLRLESELAPEDLLKFAAATMPHFMVPRFIDFRTQLPRTETMKVRKVDLRKVGVTPTTWDAERAGYKVTRRGIERVVVGTSKSASRS